MTLFFRKTKSLDHSQVTRVLHELRDALVGMLGDELVGLIVYGDATQPERFDPAHSSVDVMLVLGQINCDILDRGSAAVAKAQEQIRLTTMTLTQEDLQSSCDVFPVKFHTMQQRHRVIHGKDVLSKLKISDEHLRLRCEQETKNLMIRLRASYFHHKNDREHLLQTLTNAVRVLVNNLGVCLLLKIGAVPQDEDGVVAKFAEEFPLDPAPIRDVLKLQGAHETPPLEDLKRIFDAFMAFVHDTARAVDGLDESP